MPRNAAAQARAGSGPTVLAMRVVPIVDDDRVSGTAIAVTMKRLDIDGDRRRHPIVLHDHLVGARRKSPDELKALFERERAGDFKP